MLITLAMPDIYSHVCPHTPPELSVFQMFQDKVMLSHVGANFSHEITTLDFTVPMLRHRESRVTNENLGRHNGIWFRLLRSRLRTHSKAS